MKFFILFIMEREPKVDAVSGLYGFFGLKKKKKNSMVTMEKDL